MASQWFYQVMGNDVGPVSGAELKDLAQRGVISGETLVRKAPDGTWVLAERLQGLLPTSNVTPSRSEEAPLPNPPRSENTPRALLVLAAVGAGAGILALAVSLVVAVFVLRNPPRTIMAGVSEETSAPRDRQASVGIVAPRQQREADRADAASPSHQKEPNRATRDQQDRIKALVTQICALKQERENHALIAKDINAQSQSALWRFCALSTEQQAELIRFIRIDLLSIAKKISKSDVAPPNDHPVLSKCMWGIDLVLGFAYEESLLAEQARALLKEVLMLKSGNAVLAGTANKKQLLEVVQCTDAESELGKKARQMLQERAGRGFNVFAKGYSEAIQKEREAVTRLESRIEECEAELQRIRGHSEATEGN